MDPQSFVEGLFGIKGESSMTPQSQFHNKFAGFNNIPIFENIPDLDALRSGNPIDLDNVCVFRNKWD